MLDHVAPGVAAELVAAGGCLAFALAVELPGVSGRVVAVRIELDGQLVVRPTTVDKATAGQTIRDRQRQPRGSGQLDECAFEMAERLALVAVEDLAERPRALAFRSPCEHSVDTFRRRPMLDRCLVDGAS